MAIELTDLDEYFCKKYANYDKLCTLPGYRMPKMQTSEVREDGRTYAYTLPANTMRLALQENNAELLADLKTKLQDKTFSFSFTPLNVLKITAALSVAALPSTKGKACKIFNMPFLVFMLPPI